MWERAKHRKEGEKYKINIFLRQLFYYYQFILSATIKGKAIPVPGHEGP
jgi:hypothetical protein